MTKKTEKSAWTANAAIAGAAMAGAAIGSAALAAALLYASRRKDADKPTAAPIHPEDAPETD